MSSSDDNFLAIFERIENDDKKVVKECEKLVKKYFDKSHSRKSKDIKLSARIDNSVLKNHILVVEVPSDTEGVTSEKFFVKFERSTDMLDWLNDNCKRYRSLLNKGDSLIAALRQLDFEPYGY